MAPFCRATAPSNVRFLEYSGREMLAVRLSHFDPNCDIGWIEMP
jgi:hypothetical protein